MRQYFAMFLILAIFIAPWFSTNFPVFTSAIMETLSNVGDQLAAVVISHKPVTVGQLKYDYVNAVVPGLKKIRILLVPGHEPDFGGAEYGKILEREISVELANELQTLLSKNEHFEVYVTRDKKNWKPEFANYFKSGWEDIKEWTKAHRAEVEQMYSVGSISPSVSKVTHNTTRPDVGLRLQGINKWANENDMDIVIHMHLNDYTRYSKSVAGTYTGFSIYVPEKQFYNSTSTRAVADNIFKRLEKYNAVSDLPGERAGIIEESNLIAIGSFNSVDAASMLIEYGYIYEPQFADSVRNFTIKELAYETYIGIMDFFDPKVAMEVARTYDTVFLPHKWTSELSDNNSPSRDVYALQTALVLSGDYPPDSFSPNSCPRTGKFGPCTKAALKKFQNKFDINDEVDEVGPKTRDVLNRIYSSKPEITI